MQVAAQVLRPRVQHQREGAAAAQPPGVGGELRERRRGALHQRVVDPAWMDRRQRVELVRQREYQMAVGHIQQFAQASAPPCLARLGLALRAMPIAAGVPAPLLSPAGVALQQLSSQCRRAAGDDGAPGPGLCRADAMRAQVLGPEAPQHFGQGDGHGRPQCKAVCSPRSNSIGARRIPSGASGRATCR